MRPSHRDSRFADLIRHVGGTPILVLCGDEMVLVKRGRVTRAPSPITIPNDNRLVLKLEHLRAFNPTGSAYDRVYLHLIQAAETRRLIRPGQTPLIECSVGNAAASFAWASRAVGYSDYSVILPEDIFEPRIELARSLGAKVIFSPPNLGPAGYIQRLEELAFRRIHTGASGRGSRVFPISKILRIPRKPYARLLDEVEEDLAKLGGPRIDALAFGVGSGNTISLLGAELKRRNRAARVVCSEFRERPFVYKLKRGGTPALGGAWVDPEYMAGTIHGVSVEKLNLDPTVIDDVCLFDREERDQALHVVNEVLGLGAGRSTSTIWCGAWEALRRMKRKTVFTIVFDDLSKYLGGPALWDLDGTSFGLRQVHEPSLPRAMRTVPVTALVKSEQVHALCVA